MDDLEIIQECAKAMGLMYSSMQWLTPDVGVADPGVCYVGNPTERYDPLHDDAQAMALVKKLTLEIWFDKDGSDWVCDTRMDVRASGRGGFYDPIGLNRAICECVAKMQAAKRTKSEPEKQ